jgi:glutamate-1-semialdehyde 2,1-aminomutase
VGAFGGRSDIMDCLAPLGPVYQAGTLSGNPLAMAAGIASLELLTETDAYRRLETMGTCGRKDEVYRKSQPHSGSPYRVGSMFCVYFTEAPVTNLSDAMKSDRERFARYFHLMLEAGIYLAPSQFEAGFLSTAHTEEDIEKTLEAASAAFKKL